MLNIDLENQLNNLAKLMKDIRRENEYNEIELNQFKQKLSNLEKQFNKSITVYTEQTPRSFINRIFVTTPVCKSNFNEK